MNGNYEYMKYMEYASIRLDIVRWKCWDPSHEFSDTWTADGRFLGASIGLNMPKSASSDM